MKLIGVTNSGRVFVIRFPYNPYVVDAVKELPERKFSKENDDPQWRVPVRHCAQVMAFAEKFEFDFDEAAKAVCDRIMADRPPEVDPFVPPEFFADMDIVIGKRKLFKHQISGVMHLVRNRFAILADDMGLGKTTQALVAARMFNLPIVVIAPASLKENWRREAKEVETPLTAVYTWAKFPSSLITESPFTRGFVAIFDEAHYGQAGTKSQRGDRFLSLCEEAAAAFLLTGTPLKNGKPINIMPLLEAIRHPIVADKKRFQIRYCDAHATAWTRWDVSGAANLDELHDKTKDKILRRLKSECLDLPQFMRVMRQAEINEETQRLYDRKFAQLRAEYFDRLDKGTIRTGAEALVVLTQLRQAASIAKIDTTVELVEEIVEQCGSVVVFVNFKETLQLLQEQISSFKLMDGDTTLPVRQALVDGFQRGEFQVLGTTFGTGGVGLNLHRASTVILHDRPWTPADAEQAESRVHRYGQKQAVQSIWIQYGQVDVEIDDMLEDKAERIQLVLAGERKTMRGTLTANDVAMKVIPKLFNEG